MPTTTTKRITESPHIGEIALEGDVAHGSLQLEGDVARTGPDNCDLLLEGDMASRASIFTKRVTL